METPSFGRPAKKQSFEDIVYNMGGQATDLFIRFCRKIWSFA